MQVNLPLRIFFSATGVPADVHGNRFRELNPFWQRFYIYVGLPLAGLSWLVWGWMLFLGGFPHCGPGGINPCPSNSWNSLAGIAGIGFFVAAAVSFSYPVAIFIHRRQNPISVRKAEFV